VGFCKTKKFKEKLIIGISKGVGVGIKNLYVGEV